MAKRLTEYPNESMTVKRHRDDIRTPEEADAERDPPPSTSEFILPTRLDDLIPELPVEVVSHIFRFLSVRDRRKASLVCSKWCDAGDSSIFSENEKLVFHGYQNFETLLLFLSKTKRRSLNLEFHNCTLLISSNLLTVAEKIWSLSFKDCTLSVPFKIELFSKCLKLKELYYKNTDEFQFPITSCFTSEIIESLLEKQVLNQNLKSLRVYMAETVSMTDDNVRSLFAIFPKVKHLTLINRAPNTGRNSELFFSTFVPNIILPMNRRLISLKIRPSLLHLRSLVSHSFTRLKKISLSLPLMTDHENLVFDLIAGQEYLEQISLYIGGLEYDSTFITRFIPFVIERCKYLQYLKLYLPHCYVDFSQEVFDAFVFSNLISLRTNLHLRIDNLNDDYFDQVLEASESSLTNKTLRVLSIPNFVNHQVQTLFIQSFKNLEFLELSCLFGTVLESIGLFQKNLTVLKLSLHGKNNPSSDDSNNWPEPYRWNVCHLRTCLSSLVGLENLDLRWQDDSFLLDGEIVPFGVKYLTLSFPYYSQFEAEVLKQSLLPLKKLTELEAVQIVTSNSLITDLDTWFEICCSLKKLRQLCLHSTTHDLLVKSNTDPLSETHKNLFERCPSLRCLVQKTNRSFLIFHKDQVDESVKAMNAFSDLEREDFIYTEKIAAIIMTSLLDTVMIANY